MLNDLQRQPAPAVRRVQRNRHLPQQGRPSHAVLFRFHRHVNLYRGGRGCYSLDRQQLRLHLCVAFSLSPPSSFSPFYRILTSPLSPLRAITDKGCYTDSPSARTLATGLASTTWSASNCLKLVSDAGLRYGGVI